MKGYISGDYKAPKSMAVCPICKGRLYRICEADAVVSMRVNSDGSISKKQTLGHMNATERDYIRCSVCQTEWDFGSWAIDKEWVLYCERDWIR